MVVLGGRRDVVGGRLRIVWLFSRCEIRVGRELEGLGGGAQKGLFRESREALRLSPLRRVGAFLLPWELSFSALCDLFA
jgi:hypothetical protein